MRAADRRTPRPDAAASANSGEPSIEELIGRWQRMPAGNQRERVFSMIHREAFQFGRQTYRSMAPGIYAADPDAAESDINLAIFRTAMMDKPRSFFSLLRVAIRNVVANTAIAASRAKRCNERPVLRINERCREIAEVNDPILSLVRKEERSREWRRGRGRIFKGLDQRERYVVSRRIALGWSRLRIAQNLNRLFPRPLGWNGRSVTKLVHGALMKLRRENIAKCSFEGGG